MRSTGGPEAAHRRQVFNRFIKGAAPIGAKKDPSRAQVGRRKFVFAHPEVMTRQDSGLLD